jgi:hypothetical protein
MGHHPSSPSLEVTVADDNSRSGGQDRTRVNVNEDYELRNWNKNFGCTPDLPKAAVKAVGPIAADVEKHLKGSK